jgi:DNA repair exonuclease SbcCD ATPase subunit
VAWALCGSGSVRRSEDSLRRLDAPADAPVRCTLTFSIGDTAYRVTRTLALDGSSTHDAELAIARVHDRSGDGGGDGDAADASDADQAGEVLARGAGAVTEAIAGLLDADRDTILHGCFTGRRELQQLAQLRPVERLRMLARLLNRPAPEDPAVAPSVADAVRALEQELADATERMHALQSAPDLLAKYTAELEQYRAQLAGVESLVETRHGEWSQKQQDVETRLATYRRRSDELRMQIERLAAAGTEGTCPTCRQPLREHTGELTTQLDEELYAAAQDMKWLVQRQEQLARKPPDLAEAETSRARLRSAVNDRAERAARCEQAMQELWTVATEQKRTAERLDALRRDLPAPDEARGQPLNITDLQRIADEAGALLERITAGAYDRISLEQDGRVHAYSGAVAAPVVSGGDEDLIALVLRLAIMQEAAIFTPSLDLLLLDEPFGAIDTDRVIRAASVLRELDRSQVIVATRGSLLLSLADHVIQLTT